MKKTESALSTSIDAVVESWDSSGQFIVLKNVEVLHHEYSGLY